MAKTLKDRLKEGQPIARAVYNLNNSYKKRITRYNNRINFMIDEPYLFFITFTLTDKYINLKHSTIERKIKEALKYASCWIVNQDFGKKYNRLHYHALVSYEYQIHYNILTSIYKYGAINIIPVKDRNQKALREYLLGHQEKQTARKPMMSRIKPYLHFTELNYPLIIRKDNMI